MSHTSPASFLVWSILSILLGSFLVFHLWSFDRFKCLRWNTASSGAFKRVMTYSYLCSVPLIIIYAVGNTIIKYKEGFMLVPGLGIIPKPYTLWDQTSQSAIFPFMLMFSIAWSLEMVTHLEELCFWLFLVNSGSGQQDWFSSLYFRTWTVGSVVAILYLPLITIFTRKDHLQSEAYMFLAGSLGSLCLTLWFTPVLWTFPSFLRNLKKEGVDTGTMVRLTTFHELNSIRIVFRLLFTVPLLILGADGITPHKHINESMWWTDFLAIISGFGCVISSSLTLVIFFPRSIEGEITARELARETRLTRSGKLTVSMREFPDQMSDGVSLNQTGTYLLTSSPIKQDLSLPVEEFRPYDNTTFPPPSHDQSVWMNGQGDSEGDDIAHELPNTIRPLPLRPNRRPTAEEMESASHSPGVLSQRNVSKHNRKHMSSNVNPMVHNFKSPIDMMSRPTNQSFNNLA